MLHQRVQAISSIGALLRRHLLLLFFGPPQVYEGHSRTHHYDCRRHAQRNAPRQHRRHHDDGDAEHDQRKAGEAHLEQHLCGFRHLCLLPSKEVPSIISHGLIVDWHGRIIGQVGLQELDLIPDGAYAAKAVVEGNAQQRDTLDDECDARQPGHHRGKHGHRHGDVARPVQDGHDGNAALDQAVEDIRPHVQAEPEIGGVLPRQAPQGKQAVAHLRQLDVVDELVDGCKRHQEREEAGGAKAHCTQHRTGVV
mmetsp:Transcript_12922/g.32968  ORF Transcript_12922/g.32968 Transcript_12922/m.32968 type:complete len:252 (+) Transcript_12922:822-1577(+)